MKWADADTAIRSAIETGWAASVYAAIPLVWENEVAVKANTFVSIEIVGAWSEKTGYGSTGKRSSQEGGVIVIYAFAPLHRGKTQVLAMVATLVELLELTRIGSGGQIAIEGAMPPMPVETIQADQSVPRQSPGGMYFRYGVAIPFQVFDAR